MPDGQTGFLTSPLALSGQSGVTIDGDSFGALGHIGITLENCSDIEIKNCHFINVAGVSAANCTGGINVHDCTFAGLPEANTKHGVLFNNCTGPDNYIGHNTFDYPIGQNVVEDVINLFDSHGEAGRPIVVEYNTVHGGGSSPTGTCIILGDGGGSYQVARHNTIVRPCASGISVAGGIHLTIDSNLIASDGQPGDNVGIFSGNFYSPSPFGDITISNNQVDWPAGLDAWFEQGTPTAMLTGNDFAADLAYLL